MSDVSDMEPEQSEIDDNDISASSQIDGPDDPIDIIPDTDQDSESNTFIYEDQQSVSSDSDSDEGEDIIRSGAAFAQSKGKRIAKTERISPPFLTKYERARVIGTRALQISKNSPIYVDPKETTDPILVAQQELNENKIPFIIRRYLPNGDFEDWELQELERLD